VTVILVATILMMFVGVAGMIAVARPQRHVEEEFRLVSLDELMPTR
jgi:hypothetical protein